MLKGCPFFGKRTAFLRHGNFCSNNRNSLINLLSDFWTKIN